MCEEKQTIESKDVGSLEEELGLNDPLFQPEPKRDADADEDGHNFGYLLGPCCD